ncbi:hypothetical protein FVEN_g11796 [Fusarium venenatum]|uniref:uncharacterized protein n=1 Tax=Fusarium venenatum TaxID=56646 RepID=UPI001D26FC42|nr:hypothetical protein FVEN_g11796 [Fusarium venenatum]KAH6980376.1 hypothetical protein EDB82DRAFT_283101 [Fusarium venenatum]
MLRRTQMNTMNDSAVKVPALTTPFSVASSIVDLTQLVLPAAIRGDRRTPTIMPTQNMELFLTTELRTPKLDKLHDYLWLAGLPLPARPLQRQKIMNRDIYLTEQPDEHMVWHQTKLLIKPLPGFLLCHAFWTQHLCSDPALHRSATGLLLSYCWLIGHRSDFDMAQTVRLIPDDMEWPIWSAFMKDFLRNIDIDSLAQVDRRYQYGELRLSRLNSMTRFLPCMWSYENLVYGHISTSTWYQAFFERNFAWLLAAFVYISVILSAMQVGLATEQLNGSQSFKNLSYGGALLAISAALLGIGIMWLVWFVLFWYHILSTNAFDRSTRMRRGKVLDA